MSFLDQVMEAEALAVSPPTRNWSEQQDAVFTAVGDQSTNILIQAVAGSGKTTTIIRAMDFAGPAPCFLAFNKAIAVDIASKVSTGTVKTLNALGHRIVTQMLPGAELNARKSQDILASLMGKESQEYRDYGYVTSRLMGLAKNQAIDATDPSMAALEMEELVEAYGLDIPSDMINTLCGVAARALLIGFEDTASFDFDDQLYLPVMNRWLFPQFSDIFVDECQDLSTIQHLMLNALQNRGARVVAVGDRHQAIYGFRGALTDSMDQLRRKFQMLELPLSTTYRCPKLVVTEAQVYCPHIQAREGAAEGEVLWAEHDPRLFPAGQMVICRNNAPLFRAVMQHVRAKSPCKVMSNFLEQFQGFIRSLKARDMPHLRQKLDQWYEREMEAAKKKHQRGRQFGIRDRYETVKLLAEEFRTIPEMLALVARLAEGHGGPTFSTVHKAKGLEADDVCILRPDLIPAIYAESAEQRAQEFNLLYVAITRSRQKLVYGQRLERD